MGVITTGRDYANRYRPEIVDWLLGNTGDWQSLTLVVRFGVEKIFTQQSPVLFETPDTLVNGDGTDWSEYGFDIGDTFNYTFTINLKDSNGNSLPGFPQTLTGTRTISLLAADTLTYTGGSLAGTVPMAPYNSGQIEITDFVVWADKQPQGAILTYGHLQNADVDSLNLNSFIDGTLTRLAAENMHTLVGWQPMEFMGLQSGMSIRSAGWAYWGKIGTHYYQYAFNLEFMISSFFEDLTNFELQEPPAQTFDAASLTDNFEIIGYPEWNNPNTQIKNDMNHTKRLGNTGWFNENWNGLDDDFTILSVTYEDVGTASPTSELSYSSETRVRATIGGVQNIADGLTLCSFGFIWLSNDEDTRSNLETPFHQNTKINTAGGFSTGAFPVSNTIDNTLHQGFSNDGLARMDVKDVRFQNVGGNIEFEAVFVPTASFKNYIDSIDEVDRNYALWVSVADRTLVTNFSNRVNKLLDYNRMSLFVPPIGEFSPMAIEFFEHPQDGSEQTVACGTDYFVEDDLLARIRFNVDIDEPDEIPNAIEFAIEAENDMTGQKVTFQSYKVDLSTFPVDGLGVPQWNYDAIRGFKLETGNNKNWVKVQREPALDSGNSKAYVAFYGFKIRWEDWIARTGMPADFFDASELNNGFNNDWFQALQTAGWTFQFTVYLDAVVDGNAGRYVNEKPFTFKDYDSNLQVNTTWRFFRDSDNTQIPTTIDPDTGKPLGVILNDEQVRIEVDYERTDGGTWANLDDVYATCCIEVDGGAGQFELRQLSSIWGSESDNPLLPPVGQTNLELQLINPTTVRTICLVEPSLLIEAPRYKNSGRIGCKTL